MTENGTLDSFDRAILAEIQRDTRVTYEQLADRVNLSESAARRRLQKLRASGIVRREVALLDGDRLGFTVIVGMRCSEESESSYARLTARWDECASITQVYNTSGEADFILVTHFPDMPAYDAWLKDYVIGDPDIERCDSSFCFSTVKFETAIPV